MPVASWDLVSPDAVREIENIIQRSGWPLYVFGHQGRGKTCLAALVHQTWPVGSMWYDVGDLILQVKTCRRDGSFYIPNGATYPISEAGLLDRLANAPLLVLDDIGIRTPTDTDIEILTRAANARAGKPLIVTSNLDVAELNRVFGARLASRLLAGTVIGLIGSDRRTAQTRVVDVRA